MSPPQPTNDDDTAGLPIANSFLYTGGLLTRSMLPAEPDKPQQIRISCTNCTKQWVVNRAFTTTSNYKRHYDRAHPEINLGRTLSTPAGIPATNAASRPASTKPRSPSPLPPATFTPIMPVFPGGEPPPPQPMPLVKLLCDSIPLLTGSDNYITWAHDLRILLKLLHLWTTVIGARKQPDSRDAIVLYAYEVDLLQISGILLIKLSPELRADYTGERWDDGLLVWEEIGRAHV